jgi:hypothetical protein
MFLLAADFCQLRGQKHQQKIFWKEKINDFY